MYIEQSLAQITGGVELSHIFEISEMCVKI